MSFGETITFGVNTMNGIFDADSAPGGEREGPRVRLRTSDVDLYTIVQGSVLTIRSSNYVVEGLQPDGVGSTMVILTGGR